MNIQDYYIKSLSSCGYRQHTLLFDEGWGLVQVSGIRRQLVELALVKARDEGVVEPAQILLQMQEDSG